MKSHCLVLGCIAIVAYVSAQDFNRAKRMSLAVVDKADNYKAEFHQKVEDAKASLQGQVDAQQADISSKFLDCLEEGKKEVLACQSETIGKLPEDQQAKLYEIISAIAPSASDDDTVDDDSSSNSSDDDEDEE